MLHAKPSVRPCGTGRRALVVTASGPGSFPSRPGGSSRVPMSPVGSGDEVPSDAEGDVPVVGIRPSGGAFRGTPTPEPGSAGHVGILAFDRPGGGATRFNMPSSSTLTPASGPTSPIDSPSRFTRPAGGAARMFPSAVSGGGGGGGSGSTGGSGGGGSGGSGGAGGDDEPLGFSSLAPWALAYVGICGALYAAHETILKKPAPPKKTCCGGKKAAAAADAAAAPAADAKAGKGKGK
ncbi:hypothetical protein HYH02_006583 [Chlamydomonas schloesseri]|uniref:Uncharacterized protein n=1 Tax=Chlamydomonas schloesseri TaxID=2026947 RepID=A0A835TIL7_9CHLO|nr:hypothetical protein HYH02_006583 [Chlamydomonas schloesseri]|eukprot:KAG2439056.1 hypothetical protein HYH02_006583 [Chlamydomonas schloesseri]